MSLSAKRQNSLTKFAKMKLAQKLAVNFIRARLNLLAVISKERAAARAFEIFCTPLSRSRKKSPPIFDKAEKINFELNGNKIRGFRWNSPQEKKLLIVHGFESAAYNFDRYVAPLLKKGYEVIAFDAPAHGFSDGKQITLPLYIKTIETIDKMFGPITAFLGHSFGGLAITHFLETKTYKVKPKVVMIAPATETTTAIDSFFKFLHLNGEVRKSFDSLVLKLGGNPPEHYSILRALRNISASVLWIHDEDDDVTPLSDVIRVKEDGHEDLELIITKGFGHSRIYRENQVVKKVVDFF